jgi:hypothetical protein
MVNNVSDQLAHACEAGSVTRPGGTHDSAKAQFLRQDEALLKRGTATIDLARRPNPAHCRRCERYLVSGSRWR